MVSKMFMRWLPAMVLLGSVWLVSACQAPAGSVLQTPVPAEATATVTTTATPLPTLAPAPSPTPTPEPLAEPDAAQAAHLSAEGHTLFVQSDLAGAEAAFIDAIAADPNHVPAYIGLTEVYLYRPQYWQQALATAQQAQALAPDDPTVVAHLAWAQQGAHHFDEAWDLALHAVDLDPANAVAQTALADILSSVYEVDEAYEHAQRAVELADQSAVAWATLGSVTFALHNWAEAGDAYERATQLEPEFFLWHLLRARYEMNVTGDVVRARELAQAAIDVQPNHATTLFFLVDAAAEENRWAEAEANCRQAMKLDQPYTPFPDPYVCMAGVLIQQEHNQAAAAYQNQAEDRTTEDRRDVTLVRMRLLNDQKECAASRQLAQDWLDARPYSVSAQRMIGVSYLCSEEYESAVASFRQTFEDLPRSVDDARLLAVAYAHNDQASEALATLNAVRSFASSDPTYYRALYEVHLILGEYADSLRAAQRWQVLRPDSTTARENLAFIQLIQGNINAAQSAAEEALAAGARSSTVYAVLGEAALRQGELEQAEGYLLKALDLSKDFFLAHNSLAALYLSQNRCDEATPHVQWLLEQSEDGEQQAALEDVLQRCREAATRPTPDPSTALADAEAVTEAEDLLAAAEVEAQFVDIVSDADQRSFVVIYLTGLAVDSAAFNQEERDLAFGLARLLPRIASQPDALVLISTVDEQSQRLTLVSTRAAALWVAGQLSDEEFEGTWLHQEAGDMEQ